MVQNNSATLTLTLPSDREVVMTRLFDAPRELVYKAFTDPTAIPQWWGPRYLTTTVDKLDLRPGGQWRFVQVAPDGTVHAFHGEYREVVPPARVVNTFEYEPMPGHVCINTVTLEESEGKTKLTASALFESVEDRDGMIRSGMESGAAEGYDRLEELLVSMA